MLKFIDEILLCFRPCFSRMAAFEWFATIITGLMVRSDSLGITSIIRNLVLAPSLYSYMEYFFHADSWDWYDIFARWAKTVSRYASLKHISGRTVLIGDGVKCASVDTFLVPSECWTERLQNLSAFPCPSRSMVGTVSSVNGLGMNLYPMSYRCSVTVSVRHSISETPCLSWTGTSWLCLC